ncbi:hypothetical protein C0991_008214 [Blastosporella zonata]|nr:hypothetical protein C0991_008214 [Blastosporella zonata]
MSGPLVDLRPLGKRLSALLEELRISDSVESWKEVEITSQTLANGLRIRDVDNHSNLGETALPRTLTSFLTLALHGFSIPPVQYTAVVFELLRVTANLLMDHDENRGRLLEAGLPQAIISLLEGYVENAPPPPHAQPIDLSVSHLKVIKTSVGALLNASVGYDAVKFRLISLEAPLTILKLSTAIYPTGYWADARVDGDGPPVGDEDEWSLRSGLSDWAWLAISELKDVKDDSPPIITPDFLPLLVQPLTAYLPKISPTQRSLFGQGTALAAELIDVDLRDLQDSCMLIESSALDLEDVRLSLARGLHFPAEHNGLPCLSIVLDFIEKGTYPASWSYAILDQTERKQKEKAFNICKAALIKAVVEVAGEDQNSDVLWDDSEPEMPGGNFVYRMVDWLKRYVEDLDTNASPVESISDREDMVICASLSLGNLARRVPVLASPHLLSPSTDIKVKHGVIALLKHLAQAPPSSMVVQSALEKSEIIRRIVASGVWDEKADAMADVVQLSAIGVAKHMAGASVEHVYVLVLPSTGSPNIPIGLTQILALVKRTDSLPIKSEGSRVLVNVVKTLWGNKLTIITTVSDAQSHIVSGPVNDLKQRKHNAAIRAILTLENASVLAKLVGGSGRYPLLVNEGLVALTMFSIPKEGGMSHSYLGITIRHLISPLSALLVLEALTISLTEVTPDPPLDPMSPPTTASDVGSPISSAPRNRVHLNTPRHALDMLVFTLKNVDNPVNFPVEVRSNVCSLLIQLSKHSPGDKLEQVKEAVRPVLETLLVSQALDEKLESAARRLQDAWL